MMVVEVEQRVRVAVSALMPNTVVGCLGTWRLG